MTILVMLWALLIGGDWSSECKAAGRAYGFDWRVLCVIVEAESGGDPGAVGASGEIGLMQIVPFADRPPADALLDPKTNMYAGAAILREYVDACGGLACGLAAYNEGIGAVLARGVGIRGHLYLSRLAAAWRALWGGSPIWVEVTGTCERQSGGEKC